jgi:hypothetical protein
MPTSGGGFGQACKAQAGVDTLSMFIVPTHDTQASIDKQKLVPAQTNLLQLPEEPGMVDTIIATLAAIKKPN